MILQSLVQYYEALVEKGEVTKPGWCRAKVSFALELGPVGELLGVIPLKEEVERGKKMVEVPKSMTVPEMITRSSGVAANFLCDNSSYILGIDNKGKPERSKECLASATKKHLEILGDLNSGAAKAVTAFFKQWVPETVADHPVLLPWLEEILGGGNLIFMFEGRFVHEDPEIMRAWEESKSQPEEGQKRGTCLVTGEETEIARIHGLIKGVQGAQSSGASLVSFNAPCFWSYGKEQSYNAPVGTYAAFAYTTALNHLLSDRNHTFLLGDTTILYWSEEAETAYQDCFLAAVDPKPDAQEILQGLFKNLSEWRAVDAEAVIQGLSMSQKFYIMGLAPNAARLSVRFFYQDSFGNILNHIKSHYDRMKIVRPSMDTMEYLGIWRMLQETVNKKSKDKKPVDNMAAAAFRSILSGERYPRALYTSVLGRIRAEQDDTDNRIYKITRGRAAIIKAYLLRNFQEDVQIKEAATVGLNENSNNIPYTLGREFAVLEAIQEEANPGINATIKDRYFNSACATPAAIFPILFKLKNSHTRKFQDKRLEIYYEKMLCSMQDKIPVLDDGKTAYPRSLTLEEQGMFILGYYHQTQKRYEKKIKEDQ